MVTRSSHTTSPRSTTRIPPPRSTAAHHPHLAARYTSTPRSPSPTAHGQRRQRGQRHGDIHRPGASRPHVAGRDDHDHERHVRQRAPAAPSSPTRSPQSTPWTLPRRSTAARPPLPRRPSRGGGSARSPSAAQPQTSPATKAARAHGDVHRRATSGHDAAGRDDHDHERRDRRRAGRRHPDIQRRRNRRHGSEPDARLRRITASGTTVLVGTTVTITCEATNDAGNTGTDTEAFRRRTSAPRWSPCPSAGRWRRTDQAGRS